MRLPHSSASKLHLHHNDEIIPLLNLEFRREVTQHLI